MKFYCQNTRKEIENAKDEQHWKYNESHAVAQRRSDDRKTFHRRARRTNKFDIYED